MHLLLWEEICAVSSRRFAIHAVVDCDLFCIEVNSVLVSNSLGILRRSKFEHVFLGKDFLRCFIVLVYPSCGLPSLVCWQTVAVPLSEPLILVCFVHWASGTASGKPYS